MTFWSLLDDRAEGIPSEADAMAGGRGGPGKKGI